MPVAVSDDPIALDAGVPCEACCEPPPDDGFGPSDCCDGTAPQRITATFTSTDIPALNGIVQNLVRVSKNVWNVPVPDRTALCSGHDVTCLFWASLSCISGDVTWTTFGGPSTTACVPTITSGTPVRSCDPFLYEQTFEITSWAAPVPTLRTDCGSPLGEFTITYTETP